MNGAFCAEGPLHRANASQSVCTDGQIWRPVSEAGLEAQIDNLAPDVSPPKMCLALVRLIREGWFWLVCLFLSENIAFLSVLSVFPNSNI